MSRQKDVPIPITAAYRDALVRARDAIGRNQLAELAGVDPTTIHRAINEQSLTYTTATKLVDAIARAAAQGVAVERLPPPFVAVVNAQHFAICLVAQRIASLPEGVREEASREALEKLIDIEKDAMLGIANLAVAKPTPD